jgi:hypothetical protein
MAAHTWRIWACGTAHCVVHMATKLLRIAHALYFVLDYCCHGETLLFIAGLSSDSVRISFYSPRVPLGWFICGSKPLDWILPMARLVLSPQRLQTSHPTKRLQFRLFLLTSCCLVSAGVCWDWMTERNSRFPWFWRASRRTAQRFFCKAVEWF